ncbi:Type IV fimbrial assembly protein PilC [Dissulfuribacter thermophilus]|uniref:Type IV fimbrial assembly protein PilC n=1 Tax=Dissulfuribacter thermophilus TaxID=1156395 RepID=A0A1B9F8Q1_9BACT|nr:type II secretion system F family protein [Dissulfuribacter thermophilus]OCC16309.1 Type IV fimbrial assembly protein PilC [Dissulfuribacter thermophilus]
MARFSCEYLDQNGQRKNSIEEAKSAQELIKDLTRRGLQPIKIKRVQTLEAILFKKRIRFSHEDLIYFTKELSDLLQAGVQMERALKIVADASDNEIVKKIVTSIRQAIQSGQNLSEALSEYPEIFSPLYINMVRVGEMGGVLPEVLKRLEEFLERSREIKKFIISSSIYPSVLLLVGMFSVFILVTYVVPKFGEIFEDLNQPMPLMTMMIVKFSTFLKNWWWIIAGIIFAIGVFLKWKLKTPEGRRIFDTYILKAPIAGSIVQFVEFGRMARTLGTLIESGIPILKGISLSKEVISNSRLKDSLDELYKGVRQGKSMSLLMRRDPVFPSLLVHLVAVGEETGDLGTMLLKVADDFDEKIQSRTKMLLSLIEPVTIVVMGLIIGGIILSMLMAIFGINEVQF